MNDERIGHEPIVGRRTGLIIGAALLIGNICNYGFQIVAGRSLSLESYGLLAGFMSAVTIITVSTSALQTTAAQALASGEADPGGPAFDRLTRSALTAAVAIGAGVVIATPLLQRVLSLGVVPLVLLAAYITPAAIDSLAAGRLQGQRRFGALATYSASQAVAKLFVAVVLVALGRQVTGLLAGVIVSSAFVALLGLLASRRAGSIDAHVLSPDARRAFLAITAFWAITSVDVVMAHASFTGPDAGIYAAAAVLGKAVLWLPTVVAQLVFPTLAAGGGAGSEDRLLVRRAMVVVLAVAAAAVAGLAAFGPIAYDVLYGQRYAAAATLSWKIGVAMVPMALLNLLMFQGLAMRSTAMIGVLAGALVTQIVALRIVPQSGGWYAAVLGLVAVASLIALQLLISRRRAGEDRTGHDAAVGGRARAADPG
ncbi:MAG: oligosaccharide flippase family protein [Ilumatobacteraceae bacterium]